MMHASRPGKYEYQYKADFDYALAQFGPDGPGFPSIISAGKNNFCIHYYSYTGQAQDGDMILNDVGAQYDEHDHRRIPRLAVQRTVLASSAAFVRVRAGYLGLYVFDHSPRYGPWKR